MCSFEYVKEMSKQKYIRTIRVLETEIVKLI